MLGPAARAVSMAVAISLPTVAVHEGVRYEPYYDIAGIKTVCYGETQGIKDRTYTEAECLVRLAQRVAADYEAPIQKCTSTWHELPIEARSASISLAYNIGTGAFCKSSVHREFEAHNFVEGCNKFMLWNKARVNGRLKEVKGLTNRRKSERNLCLEGVLKTESEAAFG